MKKEGVWWQTICVAFVALVFRIYELPTRFVFTADEEYQATYARTIVEHFHRIWIGVSAGATGFYLGPYWTYFTALWLKVASGDPLITGYVAAAIGAITAGGVVWLGRMIAGRRVAVAAGLLYAVLPLIVYFDARYWNPSATALLAILTVGGLIKIKENPWWLVVVSGALGALFHVHLSLAPLWLVAIPVVWRRRRHIPQKVWVGAAIVVVVMLAPLIMFDYYHKASNITTPLRMLQSGKGIAASTLTANVSVLTDTFGRLWYLRPGTDIGDELRPGCATGNFTVSSPWLAVIAIVPLIVFLLDPETRRKWKTMLLGAVILVLTLGFIAFPEPVTGYYALGIFPLYLIATCTVVQRFAGKHVKVGAILLLLVIGVSVYTIAKSSTQYGFAAKRLLINRIMATLGTTPFSLVEEGTCHKYGGWRYLFTVYGRYPESSSTDASLGWLYPREIHEDVPTTVEIGATTETAPPVGPYTRISTGGYTAYVTKADHDGK